MLRHKMHLILLTLSSVFILANASQFDRFELEHRAVTVANNSTYNSSTPSTQSSNPCASISSIASTQIGDASGTSEVPAQLAYECLQSVALDTDNATRLVKSFRTMFEFQSTTAFNKNPPSSYKMPAIDTSTVFDQIEGNITAGVYHGEYDFQLALYNLVVAVHDDHLDYTPDLVGNAFRFTRPIGLTSFSDDGISIPKLYVVTDASGLPQIAANASAVTTIDGQPASSFLEDLSQFQAGQDPDTNYNRLLVSLAASSVGNATGAFSKSKLYAGANTTLQFEDGTTHVYENKATLLAKFSSINSSEELYAQICSSAKVDKDDDDSGDDGDSKPSNQTASSLSVPPPPVGYPKPIVQDPENAITGYHLSGNYSDTAVLAISGFGSGATFQQVVTSFLAKSSTAHKTHLIIDLQTNGGGDEDPEYDMFGQLFPTTTLYEASAWRASPIFKALTQTMDDLRQSSNVNLTAADQELVSTTTPDHESFNFRDEITTNFSNFDSFDNWYGPFEYNNDTFTSASQWNLSTPASGKRQEGINKITGYGRKANSSTPVFKPENIVILTNGDCSSMCASVIEQTRTIPGLKFVAVGGRPQYGEMAIAGGTHG